MSISKMDLDLLVSFIVGPSSIVLVLLLLGVVIKQFYANLNYSRARQRRQAKPPEINLIPTHVPFTVDLKPSAASTSDNLPIDGSVPDNNRTISIEITTTIPTKTKMYFFWGINTKPFLDTIIANVTSWTSLDVDDDSLPLWVSELRELYGSLTECTVEGACSSIVQVEIPKSVREVRGTMTKQLIIPCVAVIVPADLPDEGPTYDSTAIKGLIVIYQLNSLEQRNSVEIRDRFIKTFYGFSCRLRPLFLQGDSRDSENPSSADTDDQELFRDRSNPLNSSGSGPYENQPFYRIRCTLCQTLPISRAIVPCGHLCTCAHCFAKLKYCPICRGQIQSFFKTRDESYMNSIPQFMKNTEEAKPRRLTWTEYFEELSEQLNIMLGLPEAV